MYEFKNDDDNGLYSYCANLYCTISVHLTVLKQALFLQFSFQLNKERYSLSGGTIFLATHCRTLAYLLRLNICYLLQYLLIRICSSCVLLVLKFRCYVQRSKESRRENVFISSTYYFSTLSTAVALLWNLLFRTLT